MAQTPKGLMIVEANNAGPLSAMHLVERGAKTSLCDRRWRSEVRVYDRDKDGKPDWICGACLLAAERGAS